MPENMPTGLFIGIVTLQVLLAAGLIFLIFKLRATVKAQGQPVLPPEIRAKLDKLFKRKG